MTHDGADGEREPLSLAFYEIAQILESAQNSEQRVSRVLARLRSLVPYERCGVLEALPGSQRRLITPAETPEDERAALTETVATLLDRLLAERGREAELPVRPGTHLAVPLVGLDEVVGVLYVRGAADAYEEQHVRRLSVVAAKLAAYLSMLRAHTKEVERTGELEVARLTAERATRAKDELLALVSHELRTPLNTILAWTDALRSKQIRDGDRRRACDAIERSVRAEAKLIEELLDLSSIAYAALRLDLRAVEPAKLIRAAILALRPSAELKAIQLELALDESVEPLIGDPHRLSQVVTNLVANAIKFTPEGGRVEVRLERADTLARIQVIDRGAGISPEILPKVFESFGQSDRSSTRPHGGLGVGLSLVKDLVQLHGGRVHAESASDKGTTFTVELPLATDASLRSTQPSALERSSTDQRPLVGIRVLLVDDDRDICEVLQFVLEGQGAHVTVAHSAAQALSELERSMPNVLLSDIAMPGETGYDLMRKIVARSGSLAPPAAALSAYAPGQDLEKALASGFRMLLAKPVDATTLIAAVVALATNDRGNDPARLLVEGVRS